MHTDPWGIKVATVELKHIDLPQEMQRAMAKQAEAVRERRAKVINAEGEFQKQPESWRTPQDLSVSNPWLCSSDISKPCVRCLPSRTRPPFFLFPWICSHR
jgi:hypothetical protein